MKKQRIITGFFFLLIFTAPQPAAACDICGCGVGNDYIGILPDFHKHIFGIRYRHNSLWSHLGVGGQQTYLTTSEHYNTAEAWGGWNITEKFRVMAAVPYSINRRSNQEADLTKSGVGDVTLSAFYQLINKRDPVGNKLLVQSLWLGGGVKLATGKYNPADKSTGGESANLFQLGSGSTDFSLNGMYDLRLQDAGVNLSAHYKINTANRYDYRYGNKLNLNAQAYYKFRVASLVMIAPNAGVQYEKARTDIDNDILVTVSGGRVLMGTAGMEAAYKKIAVGANFQTPFSQNLANGIVRANNRVMVHVSIAL
ncbi:transporter [Niabella sp. CC-SYL272]|uniref:transporter n=1 Tax=Niabella agricola TaxID=2891571 RepID=UPI001F353AC2|nr:transporter [Niabella agricola]MCF3107989.1 transporter [Niabella agricola]